MIHNLCVFLSWFSSNYLLFSVKEFLYQLKHLSGQVANVASNTAHSMFGAAEKVTKTVLDAGGQVANQLFSSLRNASTEMAKVTE